MDPNPEPAREDAVDSEASAPMDVDPSLTVAPIRRRRPPSRPMKERGKTQSRVGVWKKIIMGGKKEVWIPLFTKEGEVCATHLETIELRFKESGLLDTSFFQLPGFFSLSRAVEGRALTRLEPCD